MSTGYIVALITVIIWGLTFVSTKVLLTAFTPVEILFARFFIGAIALFIAMPKRLQAKGWCEEKYFIAAGASGVFLYYFLENASMLWTNASNAGVIVSTAPFFTALFSREKKTKWFFVGFAAAMAGIAMISFGSLEVTGEGILGDFLALAAAAVWGIYAVITKKISTFGYPEVQTARRSFLYGLAFMIIPLVFWNGWGTERDVFTAQNILNLLFLGIAASALCFVFWSIAVRKLGAIRTSIFIYLTPVITVIASAILIGEAITPLSGAGTLLALAGLVLSEK